MVTLRNTQQNQIEILIKLPEVLKCHNDISLSDFSRKGSNHSDSLLFLLKYRQKVNLSFITFVKFSFCSSMIFPSYFIFYVLKLVLVLA